MTKTILVIEDDTDINNMLCKLLSLNGFNTKSAFSGTEGILLHDKNVSLIILDLMLPGKNGEDIIKELKNKNDVPIIVTSAIHDVDKKLDLFKLGVDDYITKPFDNEELIARINVQLRHIKNKGIENILKYKDIEMNLNDYKVICNNKEISLTKNEFEILKVLMENQNHVVTKSTLFDIVWNNEDSADDNTLNVHISKLRNKLKEANQNVDYIETVWSVGYRLKK
ncbi:MAG TPA: DNA-binding response regulator [Firmicutes bacterium]|nr:DNA-binding response regulator [Bacillota bacterium]